MNKSCMTDQPHFLSFESVFQPYRARVAQMHINPDIISVVSVSWLPMVLDFHVPVTLLKSLLLMFTCFFSLIR